MSIKVPPHLRAGTRKWFEGVLANFELDEHHVKLLIAASESWDIADEARLAIKEHGLTYQDRYNCPHVRPEVNIARDARLSFARFLRELGLDVAPPVESPRPYPLPANGGRRK